MTRKSTSSDRGATRHSSGRRPARRGVSLLAALGLGATLLASRTIVAASAASASASTPGVTATTVTIGTTQPLTGPAAPGYDEIAPAMQAVFSAVNAHGGVAGRRIQLLVKNDEYDPTTTAALTRQLVLQDGIFADVGGLGTPTQLAVQPFLNTEKVPQLFIASGCACWSSPKFPWSFGWQPNYVVEGKILGRYVATHEAGERVGYLYQDDEFGQDGVKGLDQEIPAKSVVSRQSYSADALSEGLANQIAALRAAHAKVVVLYSIPAATALALLAAAEVGYSPQWVVSSVGADPATVGGLLTSYSKGKADASLLNGMLAGAYLPPPSDGSNPWVVVSKKLLERYAPKLPWDENSEYGVALAYSFVELLQTTGKDLTRATLVHTLETQGKHLATPGLEPLTYSASDHYGFSGGEVVRTENGSQKAVTPVYQSAIAGPITAFTGKQASPPAALRAAA